MQKLIAATQNLHQEALLILSSDQQPLYFNERLLQLWSVTPEDLLHAPWARLSQGVLDAAAFVARVGELTLSGQPGLPETFMLKDGRTLEQISYPVTLDDQRSGRVWAWRDITGREALALAQQGSQDLLAKLSAQVPGIIFQYRVYPDGRSCFPYMSDAVSRMYPGITPALIRHDATPFYAFRHPDDAQALSASIRQSADTLSLWDLEYRLVLPEQGVVWRHGRARPERLPDGSTLWSGFITDITERKQTELALRLNASVFDTSGEGILMVGPDNRIVSVNPAFTRITGYSAEEVIGQDPRLLRSGRHSPVFFAALWTAITHSGRWEGELWNRRKNGEVYPQRTAIHTVPGHGQVPDHRIAIFSDISERKRADEHIWRQANYDALTSLPNRRLLLDRLRQEIRKAQRSGEQVALLLVDLDYFKEVNDTLGHDVGDLLLMEAAARLTHCVRSSDTVARLGGDEFMVMLTGRELGHVAEKTALALGQRLGMPFVLDNERAYVSASVGITLYPDDAQDVETLFKNADQAMYAAKKAGRSQHSWFKPSMQELAQQHRVVADRLRQALAAQQFEVYYQPVVELATQRITKAEALLRWHTPGHSPVGPGVFIPIAEELGLINDIGDWAFRQVAAMALHLNQGRDPPVQLAVNKSPRQFRTDNCHTDWSHHLHSIGLDSRHMAIEITEGLLLDSRPETMEKLSELRAQGLQLALDDFGTGYSAMSYLLKFHIDYLKIDQSFVHQVNTPGGQAIVEAMVAMAHKLGLQVIAEGVETPDQLAFLRAIGCDHAQGYLFARPMPAADFERLLQHNRQGQSVWSLPVSH